MSGGKSSGFDLDSYLERWRKRVNRKLDELLPAEDAYPHSLHRAVRYSVFAGGKRLRPILCVAGCEAVGGRGDDAVQMGAAIEMVHTYSLIHDDLPAMDDDDLRRGKPTCHREFGEALAVLAGDALLTEAFAVVAMDADREPWLRNVLVAELARAAGTAGMVAGQAVDMEMEGGKFTLSDVHYIHEHKTAEMIAMSVVTGAMIGGAAGDDTEFLRQYGRKIGLAFQITDDLLNLRGGKDLGKATGTDAQRGKATYPAAAGERAAREEAERLCGEAMMEITGFGKKAEPLKAIAGYVARRCN